MFFSLINILIHTLYFLFWVTSFLKLYKDKKGVELFFKWMATTLFICLIFYGIMVLSQRNCIGSNCLKLTQELAIQLDLLFIFVAGLGLSVQAKKHEKATRHKPLPSEEILDHFLDDL